MEEYRRLNIKDWALEDRPREKLLYRGIASLSDAELVAIQIKSIVHLNFKIGLRYRKESFNMNH